MRRAGLAPWLAVLLAGSLLGCAAPSDREIYVPAGRLTLGNDESYPEERRGTPISIGSFYMDATEVTNRQFAEFVEATGFVTAAERGARGDPRIPLSQQMPGSAVFLMPTLGRSAGWAFVPGANWRHPDGPESSIVGREDEPVVQIAYEDARAYARWKGRDLPSEAEWEWAAGRGSIVPGRARPVIDGKPSANAWDGHFPDQNSGADGFIGRAPVASFSANAQGFFDLTGNVWEWTSSRWKAQHDAERQDDQARAVKGGSYLCARNFCARYRPQSRQRMADDLGTNHIGFRTIRRVTPQG